jgi:Fe-S oxidoreductase/nitrate reductase gamma subunit
LKSGLWAARGELTREVFGNQPTTAQVVFYVLSAAALAVFGWGVWRRVRLWRLGRPAAGRVSFPAAAVNLLRDGVLQARVFGRRRSVSVAHVLLFAGFAVLFLGTTLLGIEHGLAVLLGRDADHPVFHKGVYFAIYEFTTDAFGLALLAGGGVLAVRRWRRPGSIGHAWSDWFVLASLLVLGVTGYLVEGLRLLREQTPFPGFSFVGWLAAQGFAALGVTSASASGPHFVLWWFHALLALGLVAAFPYTRLLHALAGAARLMAGPAPLGVLRKVDEAEVEQTGVFGVSRISHLDRRQLLELDACVSCGRCQDACPAFEAGKPLSPRDVVQDLKRQLNIVGPRLLAGEAVDEPALAGETIRSETLWSCTTCSACTAVCPLDVNPLGLITDLRRNLIGEAQLRGPAAAALQKMDRGGNPWGLPARDRLAWTAGLDVPTTADCPDFEVLYWVGCAAAYDRRVQKVARSVVRLLKAAGVRFAVLGTEERCTGETARRMGDEFLFQQLATGNVETLQRCGVEQRGRTILTHCPHCLNSFQHDYPQMGGTFKVVHHTEYLARLAAEGRLPLDRATLQIKGDKITYHDPCYLARVSEVTEPPRRLLGLTVVPETGRKLIEMPRHGRDTSCCGAGGGRMWFDDAVAERIGGGRIAEALATGAGTVAVACPFCLIMLGDGVAARDPRVQVRDVAEILADALSPEPRA